MPACVEENGRLGKSNAAETAALWGIETGFTDAHGKRQLTEPETIERIVAALSEAGHTPATPPPQVRGAVPRAFQGEFDRAWVLGVQLYSVRSRRNWGHGDFTDLAGLIEVAAARGAAGVGLNPLHMLFPDRPESASPYSPNSRLFLNPLYIDVEKIPEFAGQMNERFRTEIDALRDTEMVAYARAAALKLEAMRCAFDRFRTGASAERRSDFDAYRAEQGDALLRFAAFEVLRRRFNTGAWWEWPQAWRAPDDSTLQSLRQSDGADLEFYEFMQWVADRQLHDCQMLSRRLGLPVGLYIDLAVGVDSGGADAWSEQAGILKGLSVGCPPDLLNTAGQDWGLTTFNPQALAASDFAPLRKMLRAAMRHAGAIRLDHVLGLMRLYVIPHGFGGKRGGYLKFPFDDMLRVVAEESDKHRCIVIGEDLGTVPEGFREKLSAAGIWSYLVVLFERGQDGSFTAPDRYKRDALATFNTHDLPTFHGWVSDHDLGVKLAIGLDPGETQADRKTARTALGKAFAQAGIGGPDNFDNIARFVAKTPSRLVIVAIEDVLDVLEQVNVPGTVDQHPNWRRRLTVDVEQLASDERLTRIGDVLTQAGRAVPSA